jgi:hypothetical protein
MSGKHEDALRDSIDIRAGDGKINCRDLDWTAGNEFQDIVKGPSRFRARGNTGHSRERRPHRSDRKKKGKIVHLDHLIRYPVTDHGGK